MPVLGWAARNGKLVLVAGLVTGIALPELGRAMVPVIPPLIVAMLFLAALRVGPEGARLDRGELPRLVIRIVLFQTAMPLLAIVGLWAFGVLDTMVAVGVVLLLAASPITGSPGLAVLSGADPTPALRQMVLGTALLPVTVFPVFLLIPVFPDPVAALAAAGRLLLFIVLAGALAILLRRRIPQLGLPPAIAGIDGLMALVMAVIVVALMAPVGVALRAGDPMLWGVLALTAGLGFGLQGAVWLLYRRAGAAALAPAMAIVAGNRNMALFLGAVSPDVAQAILLFVGCYQVPIYLTPLVMTRFYRAAA